jgi:hypothetical protein
MVDAQAYPPYAIVNFLNKPVSGFPSSNSCVIKMLHFRHKSIMGLSPRDSKIAGIILTNIWRRPMRRKSRFHHLLCNSLFAALCTAGSLAQADLYFSEYIEGSSNNKALEIYNNTGVSVDLSAYEVQMYFNGNTSAGLTLQLQGTLANGEVYVLAHSAANADILALADQTNGAGWFNGDDAVALLYGGNPIDVIGQIGFDPGTQWGSGDLATANKTLRRKSTVTQGDSNGFDRGDGCRVSWRGRA